MYPFIWGNDIETNKKKFENLKEIEEMKKFYFYSFLAIPLGIMLYIFPAFAFQTDSPLLSDFFYAKVFLKTEHGNQDLYIRLIDFLVGIQTQKVWERKSDSAWFLRTYYVDPVTDVDRRYSILFEKRDGVVLLTEIFFDRRILSYEEMRNFAERIIENYGKHISVK